MGRKKTQDIGGKFTLVVGLVLEHSVRKITVLETTL